MNFSSFILQENYSFWSRKYSSHMLAFLFSAGPGMGKTSSMAKLALDWEPSKFNSVILVTLVISCIQYVSMSFSMENSLENLYYKGDGFMLLWEGGGVIAQNL